jgi:hypothetical protein
MGGRLWWPLVLLLAGGQAQDIEVLSHICKFGLYANGDRYRVVARFLALRKDVIHTVLYIVYAMELDVFSQKNPGNTSAEICEKQQGKKSAKNLSSLAALL